MNINKYLNKLPSLENKKVIITGANSGIGFECAKHCLFKGAKLVMACRSKERATNARNKLFELYPNSEIEIIYYDQSSLKSIEELVNQIINNHDDFYALFLNAGIYHPGDKKHTVDNLPITTGTNYISNLYLLTLLKDFLERSNSERRIVVQGSLASRLSFKKVSLLDDLLTQFGQYSMSKFALYNLFRIVSNDNKNPKVTFAYVEPGITNSNITRNFPKVFTFFAHIFLKIFMMSTSKASLSGFTAISGEVNNGDMLIPRGLFRISGYPKKFKFNKKYNDDRYFVEGKEIIKKWQER